MDIRSILQHIKGNLAMVKYCVTNGYPMHAYACRYAAQKGHLDVLKYLRENDCPWNSRYSSSRSRMRPNRSLELLNRRKSTRFRTLLPRRTRALENHKTFLRSEYFQRTQMPRSLKILVPSSSFNQRIGTLMRIHQHIKYLILYLTRERNN